MQAEKVHNDCKKGTQINILANKIVIFSLLCSDQVADLIKKLELCLAVVSVLLKGEHKKSLKNY